jgi:hypothetical protein
VIVVKPSERELRRRALLVADYCEGELITMERYEMCHPDEVPEDRGFTLVKLARARRVLASLDDPTGELRRCYDAGLPIPDRWLPLL